MDKELLRKLPKIDDLVENIRIKHLVKSIPHSVVLDCARTVINERRKQIVCCDSTRETVVLDMDVIIDEIISKAQESMQPSLRAVINGTGVTLHTNLGRATLSEKACEQVLDVIKGYSNLEYNLNSGKRGSRYAHVEKIIEQVTGAESAMIVNNNAAATMLCFSAMSSNKELLVSRGELVEIGGSFRIPDIIDLSGARIVEVGSTNKTRITDYEGHITEETAALVKVHTSNYRIVGFTEDTSLDELVALGKRKKLPVIYDMGSGLMTSLVDFGIDEGTVVDALGTGIDIIMFSGDKLLGGPQAGIIAGKKKYIDMMKDHPLARVVRVDKMTLAAMEATVSEYYYEGEKENIPVLKMITQPSKTLYRRAKLLKNEIEVNCRHTDAVISASVCKVGGGSAPSSDVKSYVVEILFKNAEANSIEMKLRMGEPPIICRISHNRICIDMMTVSDDDVYIIAKRLSECDASISESEM